MVGFLNAHGTSLGLNGQFVSLNMSDDEIEVGTNENPALIVFQNAENELDVDSLTYEDNVALELIKLDTTGIVDLYTDDNPYLYFFANRGHMYPNYGDDFDTPAIALLEEGGRIVFQDEREYSYCVEVDTCTIFESYGVEVTAESYTRSLDRFEHSDNYLPSFSSNREPHHRLSYWEDDARWYRSCIMGNRHNRGRKQAKWRSDNGKLARKDSSRWSLRHAQIAMSDWYYLEHQAYTAEDYLGEHLAMQDESEQAFYEADYVRFVAKSERDADSHFDPVTQSDLVQETWLRALFPERFEPIRAYRFSDMDYYDDGYWHDDSWAYHEDDEQDESESSFMSPAYQREMRRFRLLGIEEPICVNGHPISYRDSEPDVEEEWVSAENDNDDEVRNGSFRGLTRTNIIGRQNRSALNRQLMFG